MTNPTITIHNVQTGEVLVREMNAEELAKLAATEIEASAQKDAKAKAETDKATLLAKLGITADEAKLLLS